MNYFRTALLLAAMTALFMGLGFMIGGQSGMVIALVIAGAMNVFSYWNSDKMVLRMHHAVEADERQAPELFHIVRQLAANADLPMPKVYLIDNPQPILACARALAACPEDDFVQPVGMLSDLVDSALAEGGAP